MGEANLLSPRRRSRTKPSVLVVAAVASLVLTAGVVPASAEPDGALSTAAAEPFTPPLPSTTGPIPVTEGSIPFGPAFREGAALATDLTAHGYIEEEYFVTGSANLYDYGPDGEVVVAQTDVAYTTRILVRMPEDPERFSGTVHVEPLHPQFGIDGTWLWARGHMVRSGDAFVSIATRRGTVSGIEFMLQWDPVRYENLNYTDGGLNWDVISQVGRLLESDVVDNPLRDFAVDKLLLMGVSGGAALVLAYISDGFDERARLEDGSPVYDGFLLFEPSGYPLIRDGATPIAADDARQQVQPRDVPAIMVGGRRETSGRFRPNSDVINDRFRLYEIAGAPHANADVNFPEIPVGQQLIQMGAFGQTENPLDCVNQLSTFPLRHFINVSLVHLERWSEDPTALPPRGDRLTGATDAFGNSLGGVRSSYVDVPVATFLRDNQNNPGATLCPSWGSVLPFDAAQLGAIYRNHGDYVNRVNRHVSQMVRDGWLLKEDAKEVRLEAAHFDGIP